MNTAFLEASTDISSKTVCTENIKATFTPGANGTFDVVLEVNSNKFLICMQSIADQIEMFEIIAVKGFIELSNRIILTIRKLVEHLRYRAD